MLELVKPPPTPRLLAHLSQTGFFKGMGPMYHTTLVLTVRGNSLALAKAQG